MFDKPPLFPVVISSESGNGPLIIVNGRSEPVLERRITVVKRISITLAPYLQRYIANHKGKVDDPLWKSIGTALRVPADIVSILVDDLSRGARFPYDIAPPKTSGHMKEFQSCCSRELFSTQQKAGAGSCDCESGGR